MNIYLQALVVLIALGSVLFFGVLFFGYLKYLKKTRVPSWTFPDYVRVSYFDYLVSKYIKGI